MKTARFEVYNDSQDNFSLTVIASNKHRGRSFGVFHLIFEIFLGAFIQGRRLQEGGKNLVTFPRLIFHNLK